MPHDEDNLDRVRFDIHLYVHHHELAGSSADRKLDQILARLGAVERREIRIMDELKTLQDEVKAATDIESGAVILINGIAARIAAAGTDPAALTALTDSLKSSSDALSAAVIANTPAA